MDTARSNEGCARWPIAGGEMAQRVREHDWAATPLGPSDRWPQSLRTTVQTLLPHPLPTIVLWGPQLIQLYNDAYRDLMGVKHPAGLGQPTRACWPEVWHINAPLYERVWRGESVSLEDALFPIRRSGQLEDAWFSLTYSPVWDEAGQVGGVLLTVIETTRRLRAEAALRESQARQAFLLRLSDALRPLQEARAIKLEATRLLGEQLRVNRAFYAEVRGDDWLVAQGYEQGVAPLSEGPYSARTYGPWIMAAYRAAQRIVFHDTSTDPRFSQPERQAHAAVQILAAVGVPLVKQGVLVAILAVHSAAPRHWSDGEVALVEETAERTWAAVERARAQNAQRQSEARLAMIFERAPVGLSEIAADGRFVRVNPELGRIVGREIDELLRLTIADVTHPDDVAISVKAAARVLSHGGSVTLETRYRRPDGTLVVAQSSLTRLEAAAGDEPRLLAVTVDLTARRQAEAELREREAQHGYLVRLGDALRSLADPVAIQYEAARVLGEQLGAARVLYGEVSLDGAQLLVERDFVAGGAASLAGRHHMADFGPALVEALAARRPVALADTAAAPGLLGSAHQAYAAQGIAAIASVPLARQGRLVASLVVHHAAPHAWTRAELAVIRETAERTWAAVEQARTQAALRRSEQRLALAFETLPMGIGITEAAGNLVMLNDAMHRFIPTGIIPSRDPERLGRWRGWDAAGRQLEPQDFPGARALRGETVSPGMQMLYLDDDGKETWTEVRSAPLRDGAGDVTGALLVVIDVDRLKRSEEAARHSEERLLLAVNVGELATWDWDLATGQVVWSPAHFRMQGYAVGEVEPSYQAWIDRVHPQDRAAAEAALRHAREQHLPYTQEFRVVHADGAVRWLSAQGCYYYDDAGRAVRMIGVVRDVSEQRHARELLEQQVAERTRALRQLLVHMETLQDDERRRIARELHDGLGQYLTSVTLAVNALRQAGDYDLAVGERLQRLNEVLHGFDQELDRVIFLLRPTALEDGGLGEGVAAYARTWGELTGVAVDVELQGLDGAHLDASVEAAVFRVVQEALNNVAKYAQASQVSVSLGRRRGQLVGSIEDDGVGFEVAHALTPTGGRSRWGLLGMRERIEALDGTFAIESQPGRGTTVLLRLPLRR